MAMECPTCGGHLVFKPGKQLLECPYCNSIIDAKNYKLGNAAEKQSLEINQVDEQITVDIYTCKHCGAELCAPEEQIVSFCMYCGGQATLLQKATSMQRPAGIIPFKINKDRVRKIYSEKIAKIPFVPRDFKNANFIEGFRGIYIPYWKTSSDIEGKEAQMDGVVTTSYSSYDLKEFFDYSIRLNGRVQTGTYDASEAFDDTIASAISPFKRTSIVPFEEGYLSGFYADKATVGPETYSELIKDQFAESIKKEVKEQMGKMETSSKMIREKLPLERFNSESLLFPVWFLTWRKKNRVSYSVMNGETGTLCVEAPVDYAKFFLTAFVVSAILSGIMCLIPAFIIPYRVATISGVLLYISSYVYRRELRRINQTVNHTFDIGSNFFKNRGAKLNPFSNSETKGSCALIGLNVIQYLFVAFCIIFSLNASSSDDVLSFFAVTFVLQLILFAKQLKQIVHLKNKIGLISMILSVSVMFAGCSIASRGVQEDMYYYGISIGCLSAMIINIVTSIFYTNYLATRPVPNFYTREGANNDR